MRVGVDGSSLQAAVKATAASANARIAPIMQGALLLAEDDLTVSTFDYDAAAVATLSGASVGEPGRALISHKLLAQVAAQVGSGDVTLDDSPGRALLVTAGRASWRLPMMAIEDYPQLPTVDVEVATASAADFAAAIDAVAAAASEKIDATPPLDVVRLVIGDGEISLAALDGFRLHTAVVPAACEPLDGITLVPARRLAGMAKHLGAGRLTIYRSPDLLALAAPHARLTTRLADDSNGWQEPEKLLASCETRRQVSVVVARDEFHRALKQVGAFAEEAAQGHRHVTLSFTAQGEVLIEAGTDAGGSGSTAIESQHDGDGLRIVSNLGYLLQLLDTVVDSTIRLSFIDPGKPVGISTADGPILSCLMPVRHANSGWLDPVAASVPA